MKRTNTILITTIFGLTILVGAAYAAEKFGYVDLNYLFSEYTKTKDYDKVLGEKQDAYTTERDKKVSEIKQFQDKLDLLSDKEKEAKKTDLETKLKELQEFDRLKQMDLRKEQNEKRVEIVKDIETVIKEHARKEGYTLIFNEAGVIYNAKGLDITDKMLSILNKGKK